MPTTITFPDHYVVCRKHNEFVVTFNNRNYTGCPICSVQDSLNPNLKEVSPFKNGSPNKNVKTENHTDERPKKKIWHSKGDMIEKDDDSGEIDQFNDVIGMNDTTNTNCELHPHVAHPFPCPSCKVEFDTTGLSNNERWPSLSIDVEKESNENQD